MIGQRSQQSGRQGKVGGGIVDHDDRDPVLVQPSTTPSCLASSRARARAAAPNAREAEPRPMAWAGVHHPEAEAATDRAGEAWASGHLSVETLETPDLLKLTYPRGSGGAKPAKLARAESSPARSDRSGECLRSSMDPPDNDDEPIGRSSMDL